MTDFYRMGPAEVVNLSMTIPRLVFLIGIIWMASIKPLWWRIKLVLVLSLILQIALILWYLQDWPLFIHEGLPLYHCRLVNLALVFACFSGRKQMARIFAFMGLYGSTMAYLLPDPSPYAWPHITLLVFLAYHFLLALISVGVLKASQDCVLSLGEIIHVIGIMNSGILLINIVLQANYAYLMALPFSLCFDPHPLLIYLGLTTTMVLTIYGGERLLQTEWLNCLRVGEE